MKSIEFDYLKAYYYLRLIRRAEEKIIEIYSSDKIKSPVHLSIGQENIAVGVCSALTKDDVVFSNYRGHAHYIARGGDLNKMWAELYGKKDGHSGGKAGSMHLMDLNVNFMAASAIVASAIPNAVGYAFAKKSRGEKGVVVCFHGDGATDEGVYWESMNFAALFKLPILFICENNGYAIYSKQKSRSPKDNIVEKVNSFGVKAERLQSETTKSIMKSVEVACDAIRKTNEPMMLECMTYRWFDHVGPGDDHLKGFRDSKELVNWKAKNELKKIQAFIKPEDVHAIDLQVEVDLEMAINFAENSPFPTVDELGRHVYA